MAVVEGYTDVIAAHQVGLENVVGTLGTALGEDHLTGLQRLADRVVLVFDGDEAGMSAADRSLELFLASRLDLRVLTLPAGLDPCDFLLRSGAGAFRELAEWAPEPLAYLLDRAAARFDLGIGEGTQRAAEWVLGIMNAAAAGPSPGARGQAGQGPRRAFPPAARVDGFADADAAAVAARGARRDAPPEATAAPAPGPADPAGDGPAAAAPPAPIRLADLDRTDLELMQVALDEPAAVEWLSTPGLAVEPAGAPAPGASSRPATTCTPRDSVPSYENLMIRLDDPALRALAADLVTPSALRMPEPGPIPTSEGVRPAPWLDRLERLLVVLDAPRPPGPARGAQGGPWRRPIDMPTPMPVVP